MISLLLEEAQQLGLHVERQVADFVEEQRAAGGRPNQPRLIDDRAGEAAAPVTEELAVGEIAAGRRAVEGQEHRGAAMRADVDGPRDELLARSAFAGDEHREIVALQPLNLFDDARHGRARREEAGQQRFEGAVDGETDGPAIDPAPRTTQIPDAPPPRSSAAAA